MAGPREDIYCDDFGTYWLRAEVWPEGDDARREAAALASCDYEETTARLVHGVEEDRDGEPWFTPQAGDAVFWEIDTV